MLVGLDRNNRKSSCTSWQRYCKYLPQGTNRKSCGPSGQHKMGLEMVEKVEKDQVEMVELVLEQLQLL